MLALLIVSLHLCEFIQTLRQVDFAITFLQTQIIANIVQVTVTIIINTVNVLTVRLAQFAFVLFTMAKEERVKESGGRGLPLSLQSLQGGSTVDTGKNICGYKKYLQMIHLERRYSQDDPRNIFKSSLP